MNDVDDYEERRKEAAYELVDRKLAELTSDEQIEKAWAAFKNLLADHLRRKRQRET